MDITAYTQVGQFMEFSGLLFQSKIMESFKTSLPALGGSIFLAAAAYSLVKGFLAGKTFTTFGGVALSALLTVGILRWDQGLNIQLNNSDSSKPSIQTSYSDVAKSTILGGKDPGSQANVNGLFAFGNKAIDALINVATRAVQYAATGSDTKIKVASAFTNAIGELLMPKMEQPDTKTAVQNFFNSDTGTRATIRDCIGLIGPTDLDKNYQGFYPDMMEQAITGGAGSQKYAGQFNRFLDGCSAAASQYNRSDMSAKIDAARQAPKTLYQAMDTEWNRRVDAQAQRNDPDTMSRINALFKNASADPGYAGPNATVGDALKANWMNSILMLNKANQQTQKDQGIVSNTAGTAMRMWEDFWGGAKASMVADSFPYFHGFCVAAIYTLFPFYILLGFWPGGWSFIANYFGMVFWVKSWVFFMCLVANFSDFITESAALVSPLSSLGLDFSISGMGWFRGALMYSIPLVSYGVLFGGPSSLVGLDFSPRGSKALVSAGKTLALRRVSGVGRGRGR